MDTIKENKKRMSVQIQRLLMMMVAIIVASMTVTACLEDENENDDENGGNGGGGVTGKRIKTVVQTSGPIDGFSRCEYTYNSDGTHKRTDWYDEQSKLAIYLTYTSNSNGTVAKSEMFYSNNGRFQVYNYSYDSNKKLLKAEGFFILGTEEIRLTIDYTFQNGRKIREVIKTFTNPYTESTHEYNYDSNGRRTTMTETHNLYGTKQYTFTYNSDGTLKTVTYPYGYTDNRMVTREYSWENGKLAQNAEDLLTY